MKPCGYYVLVKMETVEEKTESGIIVATRDELEREQTGHCIGVVCAFGGLAFKGLAGGKCKSPEDWGVAIGDKVEFNRYDGKVPNYPGYENHRLIQDEHIVAVCEQAKPAKLDLNIKTEG